MSEALTVVQPGALARAEDEFPVDRLVAQKAAIQRAMTAVMKDGEHFGVIPGTGSKDRPPKPSLWQAGADTLCFLFRLEPEYVVADKEVRDDLVSYDIRCILRHIDTGRKWGEGMGSCNSREKRYQSQSSAKVCPHCNKPAIIKGKEEYGGGWVCFKKKDGCGAKFRDGDEAIEGQEGQVQTAGVWDLKNTILKMACKRARVAAVLAATAASDCFTQDLEDLVEYLPPPPKQEAAPAPKATPGTTPTVTASPTPAPTAGVASHAAGTATATDRGGVQGEAPWYEKKPEKMRRLQAAVSKLHLGVEEAKAEGLKGKPREDFLRDKRIDYLNWATGRSDVTSTLSLHEDDADRVLQKAERGEVPS